MGSAIKPQGTLVLAMTALLILALAFILPVIGGDLGGATAPSEERLISPQVRAFEMQRSALTTVEGGTYFRGTTFDEVAAAMAECPTCDLTQAESAVPPHQLSISPFWMEMTEVTNAQYTAFLNTLGSGGHRSGCAGYLCVNTQAESTTSLITQASTGYATASPAADDHPVVGVTWYGANAYCEALGRRLPTEGEWEFAARGSAGTLYPWGDTWDFNAANVRGSSTNADGIVIASAAPVGDYADYASRDGIRDLAGNVAEWTADWFDADHYRTLDAIQPDDTGPAQGVYKVVRGGSWNDSAFYARAVNRQAFSPTATAASIGFRCVADQ